MTTNYNLTSTTKECHQTIDRFWLSVLAFTGKDAQLQADYVRDFIIAIFSHPSVTHFIQWGFADANFAPKPAAVAYRDLVYHQFWTNAAGQTDAAGKYSVRGFAGKYKVVVGSGESAQEINLNLPITGVVQNITLP